MTGDDKSGLLEVTDGNDSAHAIVVIHGIRQSRDALMPFAEMVSYAFPSSPAVYVYGYDYNRAIDDNGTLLAHALKRHLGSRERIDLVGYSMGGLVARMAASGAVELPFDTVITLATPNLGALSNAQLATLGQTGLKALQFLSPMWPRAAGIMDLTRIPAIMKDRADAMLQSGRFPQARRYASVPAQFYNEERAQGELGPSAALGGLQLAFETIGRRMVDMTKAHDGIVTEKSNDLANQFSTTVWNELRLTDADHPPPLRAHVAVRPCIDHDHSSIIHEPGVAALVAALIASEQWPKCRDIRQDLQISHSALVEPD